MNPIIQKSWIGPIGCIDNTHYALTSPGLQARAQARSACTSNLLKPQLEGKKFGVSIFNEPDVALFCLEAALIIHRPGIIDDGDNNGRLFPIAAAAEADQSFHFCLQIITLPFFYLVGVVFLLTDVKRRYIGSGVRELLRHDHTAIFSYSLHQSAVKRFERTTN